MSKPTQRRSQKTGLPPGTLMYIGEKKPATVRLTVIHYDSTHLEEETLSSIEECFAFKDRPTVTWINVTGLEAVAIEKLGRCFDVPALVLEDILNTDQRPKVEEFGSLVYLVFKMLYCKNSDHQVITEQVSLVLGPSFVLSFQELPGDVFESVRERLRTGKGNLRKSGPDYLAYALLDAVVDNYFVVLEHVGEKIERLEDELLDHPTPAAMRQVHHLKREMIFLRKAVWPLREVVVGLSREEIELMTPLTRLHLRDVYDHTIHVAETVDTFREMLSGMVEIYLSSISNKTNEIMKVLTIIATIFIPLSFVTGIFGMSFETSTDWWHGYPPVFGVMLLIVGGMLVYFKRHKWL